MKETQTSENSRGDEVENLTIILPTKENILLELNRLYGSTKFLDDIQAIPNSRVYVFGGSLRDTAFGQPWNDADIRITLPLPLDERTRLVEEALTKTETILEKDYFREIDLSVYHFLPAGSISSFPIDLSVAVRFRQKDTDFTINSLYLNLGAGELVDEFGALSDIQHRILRVVGDPVERFRTEPLTLFRAIKSSCQNHLTLADGLLNAMQECAPRTKEVLDYIADTRDGYMVEWYLANIFNGIGYDADRYVEMMRESGLEAAMLSFLSDRLTIKKPGESAGLNLLASKEREKEQSVSKLLSWYISELARQLDSIKPEATFAEISNLLCITTPKKYPDFRIHLPEFNYCP